MENRDVSRRRLKCSQIAFIPDGHRNAADGRVVSSLVCLLPLLPFFWWRPKWEAFRARCTWSLGWFHPHRLKRLLGVRTKSSLPDCCIQKAYSTIVAYKKMLHPKANCTTCIQVACCTNGGYKKLRLQILCIQRCYGAAESQKNSADFYGIVWISEKDQM